MENIYQPRSKVTLLG